MMAFKAKEMVELPAKKGWAGYDRDVSLKKIYQQNSDTGAFLMEVALDRQLHLSGIRPRSRKVVSSANVGETPTNKSGTEGLLLFIFLFKLTRDPRMKDYRQINEQELHYEKISLLSQRLS